MAALLALPEGGEWIVILVIVVLVFGANKLPDLTRNAARAMVEFKKVTGKDDPDAKTADADTADSAAGTASAGTPDVAADEAAKPRQDSPPA
jgi:sec-independent protein translocase protein TatA